jgi:hypothetical protein
MALDEPNGILDGADSACIFIADVDAELLLDRERELDHLKRVGAKVVGKRRRESDLALVYAEVSVDHLSNRFRDVLLHSSPSPVRGIVPERRGLYFERTRWRRWRSEVESISQFAIE